MAGNGPVRKPASALTGRLHKLGIYNDADMLLHLPMRYEDETRLVNIRDAASGASAQIEAEVEHAEVTFRPRRQLVARLRDESGTLCLRFLNFYPAIQKLLIPGQRVRAFGEVRSGFWGPEMIHPRLQAVSSGDALPQALTPIYPATAGLAQAAMRKLVLRAFGRASLAELLPDALRKSLKLAGWERSLRYLHQPPPDARLPALEDRSHPAWRRIKFDELLAQQIQLRRAYLERRSHTAAAIPALGRLTALLIAALPFALTGAQARAVDEIARDLAQPWPMQRLLQGDVGSGKTIVAALAMLQAAENGLQAALMAPTEILAEQHFRKLAGWLEPLGVTVAWLSGSQKKRERTAMLERIANGEALLVVGTHALIEDSVGLENLGLAVVDEQHRFGVRQRLALREKVSGRLPHMLMMSATPIPRTLAMSYMADLDVSVLDELPPGRTPIVTRLVADARRDEVIARVRDACREGRQAYWVCPLIEESETLQLQTAVETHETLVAELPELQVGLVHGRLKPDEKASVMDAFLRNETQVLVATTVIEVGVDVPNASLMVIEHAERFGLAQLHQLRGRVGRGAAASSCVLLYASPLSQNGRARLKAIYETTDGFEIARADLQLRGPGEFVGARQSGVPLLRYANLDTDVDLIEAAKQAAEELQARYPEAADDLLRRWYGGRSELLKA
ncbi:MAG: ATP-dependent DNA helicase RecG [Candidatus Dactylopiibacterium carminicum]|uniref:ATP-dependent DNA helicase RecG n=1 Tax=Candidatus Dactylopiibacterium carminicum TaxID=857335 RepID=A0A272EYL8_9RHOO|nr:ATP-dependent DNA helicase RecG [Candidatus Dactylopiibacterium carminicum]KAF7600562.1 ATP-dependent DNA helicase RecG [Candidatus Dactylopiibacterium carminicum]PAS94205.1 MAG: ATP-dependent DNA helicase RecG [Candidatus Dactylopiibacterium carminicum]PAS95201.1 MAG: ATP-dependent DNA helicase RecG [Candidatus Dactylopiibacterium carminicum]PAT00567.1 MAG: ATP-dependent DNA helicase RecG [Candidatus Dactylopiibacterium carminicum]